MLDKIISFFFVLLTIFVFCWLAYESAPKYWKVKTKVYYQFQAPEILLLEVHGKISLNDGCIKDEDGKNFVCGVIRYEVIEKKQK